MDDRVMRIGAIILVALGLGSCQTSVARNAMGKGEKLMAMNRSAEAVEYFDQAQALATDPLEKATALVGLGQAQVRTGQYRSARMSLYTARDQLQSREGTRKRETAARRRQKQSLETRINRWIGEAYLDGGQFELARRYLLRALPKLKGADRESVLAELSVLSRQMGDRDAATRYRQTLARPHSREVAGIVDGKSRRMNLAQKKYASRKRVPPRAAPKIVARKSKPVRRATSQPRPLNIRVFSREDWNARKPKTSRIKWMGKVSRLTIHHSAGSAFLSHSNRDTAAHIRSIQRYHQEEKKWADIGYHYVIDRTGNIWKGRDRRYQGAHAGGSANRGNIGIVVLGNYTRQGLNSSQVRSLGNLVGQLSDAYGIPHYRVYTHEELQPGHTACPGPALSRVVGQIRAKLRELHLAMGK